MSTKSIAAIMQQKHDDAVKSVTDLIWKNADGNKIADAALKGGLNPIDMEALEKFVFNAKSELEKLEVYDVAKLKSDAAAAKAAFDTVNAEFDKVRTLRSEAARVSDAAAAALRAAQQAYTEIADQAERGDLPLERVPELVSQILVRRKAGDAASNLKQKHKQLIRAKNDNEAIVENYQRQVEKIGTAGTRDNVSISSSGLVDEGELLKQRLQKSIEDQSSIETALEKCEKDITAAVAAHKKTQNPFSTEATEVSNDG